jgi:hypothetical protein
MPTPKITADDFKPILSEALAGLKAVSQEAIQLVVNKWAPRIAGLATSEDPTAERDDIMVNLGLELGILGIEAESVAGRAVASVIGVALNVVLKFATSGLA